VNWGLAGLALVTTVVTLALLIVTVRSNAMSTRRVPRHRERRRRQQSGRDLREALALVGNALAATHNPRALIPVILSVITEATGARGGRVIDEGVEVAWVGEVDDDRGMLALDLGEADDGPTRLLLYPPAEGFPEEVRTLAEWLASQAAIALENARLHHAVQRQAITDELTGLVNRRRFFDAIETEITRARELGRPLSVVLADLDKFKRVNDRFGHPAGDEVLKEFAHQIRAHSREVDVAGRLGGEEFALLLPETDLEGAAAGAERLRRSLSGGSVTLTTGEKLSITASFGVAQLGAGQSADDLLRRCDLALYRAKAAGRNRVVVEPIEPYGEDSRGVGT
jgi:diguanylate cyclase (GGDEF)-like protein